MQDLCELEPPTLDFDVDKLSEFANRRFAIEYPVASALFMYSRLAARILTARLDGTETRDPRTMTIVDFCYTHVARTLQGRATRFPITLARYHDSDVPGPVRQLIAAGLTLWREMHVLYAAGPSVSGTQSVSQKIVLPPLQRRAAGLRGYVITLEGLIGAGKSTLGGGLVKWLVAAGVSAKFFPERPHPEHLRLFIAPETRKKYAFSFQLDTLLQRTTFVREAHELAAEGHVVIVDRGFLGNQAFAIMQHEAGNIDDEQMAVYRGRLQEEREKIALMRDRDTEELVVHLKTVPTIAHARTIHRNNGNECEYDVAYFESLLATHEALFAETENLLVIDWNRPHEMRECPDVEIPRELPEEVVAGCVELLVSWTEARQ